MPNAISPLVEIDFSELASPAKTLALQEHRFFGHINLRGSTENRSFLSAAEQVLGLALPLEFNTFRSADTLSVLWLGPDEWLVVVEEGDVSRLVDALRSSFDGILSSVIDISGGNTVIEITGTAAEALLRKGCPLDLHRSVFKTGQCAQTLLGKAGITLWQTSDEPSYKLIVRRSFADYLGLWLLEAGREFVDY